MGKNFRETLDEQMKNPEFKEEWDALAPEYQIIKAMLSSRAEKSLTQKQLADITGIRKPTSAGSKTETQIRPCVRSEDLRTVWE